MMGRYLVKSDVAVLRADDGTEYTVDELVEIIGTLVQHGGWDQSDITRNIGADEDTAQDAYRIATQDFAEAKVRGIDFLKTALSVRVPMQHEEGILDNLRRETLQKLPVRGDEGMPHAFRELERRGLVTIVTVGSLPGSREYKVTLTDRGAAVAQRLQAARERMLGELADDIYRFLGLAETERDECQVCGGRKGGIPGNENVVEGIVMCDYCSTTTRPLVEEIHRLRGRG